MLLVDTHVLLWLLTGRGRLGDQSSRLVAESTVHVSAASVWELAIKEMLGKVRLPADFEARLDDHGLTKLDITVDHAGQIRNFPELSRHDPFDRLLVAQAAAEGMAFLTADRVLLALGRSFIVDATS